MATRKVRVAGAWVTKPEYVRIAGAWVAKLRYVKVAGTMVLVGGVLAATRSPTSIEAVRTNTGALTGSVTISPTGGTGSYTYNTTWLSGGSNITITNATSSTPGVTSSASPETVRSGTMRTVVSDGISSVNVDTSVTLEWSTA